MKRFSVILLLSGLASAAAQPAPVIQRLRSQQADVRAQAFQSLRQSDVVSLGRSGELLALLSRENAFVASVQERPRNSGSELSEDYAEYVAAVMGACASYCNRSDPKVNRELAISPYNYDGDFARELAIEHGDQIVGTLVTQTRSRVDAFRNQSILMLGVIGEKNLVIKQSVRDSIHAVILAAALQTADPGMRYAGLTALAGVGRRSDLGFLRSIAAEDTTKARSARTPTYPLRSLASRAITQIEARVPR